MTNFKRYIFLLTALCLIVSSCAPGPPLPPLLGPRDILGAGWLFIILLAFVGYMLWKKNETGQRTNSNHLNDAINDINDRLKRLEEKIEAILKNKNE